MMQFTEEQKALAKHAQEWIKDAEAQRDEIPFGFDEDTEKELALMKIALKALTAEPVALRYRHVKNTDWKLDKTPHIDGALTNLEQELLYTAPPVAAPAVPDGWKLVPFEPTKEMWDAYDAAPRDIENEWAAMLAAAPEVK